MKKLALLALLLILPLAQASLLDWEYQTQVTIQSNALEELDNYQLMFTLNTRTLIKLQKLNEDCSDLIFYYNRTEVPFYIENCNSAESIIWIKPPKVNALDETNLLMYYGNSEAESVSNSDEVFEFFDDFSIFDKDKWIITEEPWIKNGAIVLEDSEITSKQTFSKPIIIEYIISEERETNATSGFAFPNSTAVSNFKIIRTILSGYQKNSKAHIPAKLAKGSYTPLQTISSFSDYYDSTEVGLKFIGDQISYTDSQGDKGTLKLNVIIKEPFAISFFSERERAEIDKVIVRKYLPTYYNINFKIGNETKNINLRPFVKIVYPTEGNYSKQKPITFSLEAKDPEEQELSYKWDFGDKETSAEKSPTHSYENPGLYKVSLTASDGANEVSTSVKINIVDEPYIPESKLNYRVLAFIIGAIAAIFVFLKFKKK